MSIATALVNAQAKVAAAYSKCNDKGATMPATQDLAHLDDCIDSIPTGATEAVENDVNFYDYDGFRVASFTIAQAKALTQEQYNAILPPAHDGLTFQEWNWTLADITSYNRQYIDIGANYITTDGNTHFIATVDENICITFRGVKGTMTIQWDDGTSDSYVFGAVIGNHSFTHIYPQSGIKHIIVEFSADDPTGYYFPYGTAVQTSGGWYGLKVKEIRYSTDVWLVDYAPFQCWFSNTKISVPNSSKHTQINGIALFVNTLVIPRNTSIKFVKMQGAVMNHLIFPKNIGELGNNGYSFYTSQISRLVIPEFTNTSPLHANFFATLNCCYLSLPNATSFGAAGNMLNLANLAYIDIVPGWVPNQSMNLNTSTRWSMDGIVKFFTNLGTTSSTITLTFGSTNLNKLTTDQKAIATNKGYTLA